MLTKGKGQEATKAGELQGVYAQAGLTELKEVNSRTHNHSIQSEGRKGPAVLQPASAVLTEGKDGREGKDNGFIKWTFSPTKTFKIRLRNHKHAHDKTAQAMMYPHL